MKREGGLHTRGSHKMRKNVKSRGRTWVRDRHGAHTQYTHGYACVLQSHCKIRNANARRHCLSDVLMGLMSESVSNLV